MPGPEIYIIVRNHEDQYALWRPELELPPGWTTTGFRGEKADCLRAIEESWTDMRPRSLRD